MEDSSLHLRTSAVAPSVRVHPVVIFNILDHFIRRNEAGQRVIGTLTGVSLSDGVFEIRNSFPVPHTEGEQVGVDMEYHHNMLDLHHRVSPKETIVGWYATGTEINEASVMLHDFYGREMNHPPIHLTVDTDLKNYTMSVKAYTSTNVAFNDKVLGSQFLPIPTKIQSLEAERIGAHSLLRENSVSTEDGANIASDLESLENSIKKLAELLDTSSKYVDDVLNSKVAGNSNIGRFLAETVSSLPRIEPSAFEKMFNNSLQDLLLVVYLANLTRTQLTLAEKLQKQI